MSLLCKLGIHDYEVVGYDDGIRRIWGRSDDYDYYMPHNVLYLHDHAARPKKKVCLRCNKCVNEKDLWMNIYQEKEDLDKKEQERKNKRKDLAKKMWMDCEHKEVL